MRGMGRAPALGLLVVWSFGASLAQADKSLVVDLSKSTVYAFDEGRLVRSLVINPGGKETPTRPGRYRISQKVRKGYRSNLVNMRNEPLRPGELGAPMDYWMRLGGTGMGFHRSSLWRPSGHWGSHGCLRMSRAGARWLFDWAPIGISVLIRTRGVDLASAIGPETHGRRVRMAQRSEGARDVPGRRERVASRDPSGRRSMPTTHTPRQDRPRVASAEGRRRRSRPGESLVTERPAAKPGVHPIDQPTDHPATSEMHRTEPGPHPQPAGPAPPAEHPAGEPTVSRNRSVPVEDVRDPGR